MFYLYAGIDFDKIYLAAFVDKEFYRTGIVVVHLPADAQTVSPGPSHWSASDGQ